MICSRPTARSSCMPTRAATSPELDDAADGDRGDAGTGQPVAEAARTRSEDRLEIDLPRCSAMSVHDMGSPDEDAAWPRMGSRPTCRCCSPSSRTGAARGCGWCAASGRPTSARSTSCAATSRTPGSRSRSAGRHDRSRRADDTLPRADAARSGVGVMPRRAGRPADQAAGPRARRARGIECVEVDLAVLRGEREPELRLFARVSFRDALITDLTRRSQRCPMSRVLTERRERVLSSRSTAPSSATPSTRGRGRDRRGAGRT